LSVAASIYIVQTGLVKVSQHLSSGREHVLAFLFPGDMFGLAENGRYLNSVATLMRTTVHRIPIGALTDMFRRDGDLELRFLYKVTHELREAQPPRDHRHPPGCGRTCRHVPADARAPPWRQLGVHWHPHEPHGCCALFRPISGSGQSRHHSASPARDRVVSQPSCGTDSEPTTLRRDGPRGVITAHAAFAIIRPRSVRESHGRRNDRVSIGFAFVVAILAARPQFLQICDAVPVRREKRPHLTGRDRQSRRPLDLSPDLPQARRPAVHPDACCVFSVPAEGVSLHARPHATTHASHWQWTLRSRSVRRNADSCQPST